jgi:glycosyltransferase involved in cell wall biosynthesis
MYAEGRGLGGAVQVDLDRIGPTETLSTETIAYLTSQYGRAGDTFIRAEVEALRRVGFTIHTFSIRAPVGGEFIQSDTIRRERNATEDILGAGAIRLICAAISRALSRPLRFARALRLTLKTRAPGLRGLVWSIAYLLEASFLARRLEAKKVRHLHNHLGRNSASVAMLASVLTGIPYSLTIHGPTEFEMADTLALDEKIARAKFTVGISDFCRSQLMRFSAVKDWPRIHVVRSGLGEEFREAIPTPVPDVARIACVARFVEQKGHLVLIDAFDRLTREGVEIELDLVGDGPLRSVIEDRIRALELEKQIRLLGWKNSEQVREIIESSRALVLPSFAEGLPVSLMEAMALGRPVIATQVGAVGELIEGRVHGWIVAAGSIEELTNALREALRAPVARLTQIGLEGRERVLQRHDADREAQKLASLIMDEKGGTDDWDRQTSAGDRLWAQRNQIHR